MHACLARLNQHRVPPDYPPIGTTLLAIAAARGDLASAAGFLGRKPKASGFNAYPIMLDPESARAHFELALRRVREQWPLYDAQLVA